MSRPNAERIRRVTKFMAQGLSDQQIAERLNISVTAAKWCVRMAYQAGAPKRVPSL